MSAITLIQKPSFLLIFSLSLFRTGFCQTGITGYNYVLDTEYSGANFFNGWQFFTAGDPTNGFVQYVDQQTALSYGMINSSDTAPAYIGVDYTSQMAPRNNGGGRPSVRISTRKVWTHGLFIGDFAHAPGGICGTWPAWWTLGPNWPYTGEIDILEGVNLLTTNAMSLHTSPNYTIAGDPNAETGILQATNCAYYQGGGNGVGCGVADTRNISYGTGFNAIGGGVYAMQWTSDFIKVWFFPRSQIPADIMNKTPNPSSWGLPVADLVGNGNNIDAHFVDHAMVFDNTFCGDYAGAPGVWNNTGNPSLSCAAITGYSTCAAFVGAVPAAFENSYWSINSVRVYQLQDTSSAPSNSSSTSLTPTFTPAATTAPVPTASAPLCPTYNFTEVSYGGRTYEIECGFTLNGDDLGHPYPLYPSPQTFEDCVAMCNYWTTHNSTTCIGLAYVLATKGCYPKDKSYGNQLNSGQYAARLIWAGYGDITDIPPTATISTTIQPTTTAPGNFSTLTPVHYSNPTASQPSTVLSTANAQSSILGNGMGVSSQSSYSSSLVPASSSALYSPTVPESSSALPSSSVLAFSTAGSFSAMQPSSSAGQPMSASFSSSVIISSLVWPSGSSFPSGQATISSSAMFSSFGVSLPSPQMSSSLQATSNQASSSAIPFGSLLPPISAPTLPISAPTLSTLLPALSSSLPFSLSSQSPSLSTGSSAMPASSISSNTLSASSIAMPASSPPSLPSVAQSSVPTATATSSVDMVLEPNPTTSASLASSTTSTTAPPENGDATNYVGFTSTSTLPPSAPAATDEGDVYAGCLGYAIGNSAFRQVEESPAMTVEQCLSDCFESFYSGVSGQSCYCGISLDSTAGLIHYPDSDCNIPCPGDPSETCGGHFANEMSRRRQSVILLTTYNNTVIINAAKPPSSTSSTVSSSITPPSTISTTGVILPPTTTMTPFAAVSTSAGLLSSPATSLSNSSSAISGVPGADGIPTSVDPVGGSHFVDLSTSSTAPPASFSGSSIPINSNQSIPIVMSTVWIDVCDVCENGLTTMTTTITTLHCGCTETPVPSIPMMTSTKACAACGEGGSPATVTVTSPDATPFASASAAASLLATTGTTSAAGSAGGLHNSASGSDLNAEAEEAAAAASAVAGSVSESGWLGAGSGSSSGFGSVYANASIAPNGTATAGGSTEAGSPAPSGSRPIQASAAGNGGGPTPGRNAEIPIMTYSPMASGSLGGPLVSVAGGVTTMKTSVAGPTETSMEESKNGAGVVFSGKGRKLLVLLVAVLLT